MLSRIDLGQFRKRRKFLTEDRFLMSRGELENHVAVHLGRRAAEVLEFYKVSTGAAGDLEKATEMLRHFRFV